ncbi:MAG: tetratricopeptide repeat protein [Bacteroidetes bacterium]|nr:tetratricopeptide repeat protein [Bacteroidota bacterium]MBS1974784.1 tetratricopeptide repeat protein [Bacteroidota bacterium]
MSEIKKHVHVETERNVVTEVEQFWQKKGKAISYGIAVVVVLIIGYLGYKNYIVEPREQKASEAMFHAEEYYRMDSVKLALNGDNVNAGFVKVISKYGGTKAANLSAFYAGSCYLKLGDFNNAVKYLKAFSTPVQQLQARAYGLLGDAYSELSKKEEAVDEYKKAGTYFEQDELLSPEYLFRAGYLLESMGKNKEAIELYQKIKDRYPTSPQGADIDKYLARLGIVK